MFTYSIFCLAFSCLTFSSASAFSLSIHVAGKREANARRYPGVDRAMVYLSACACVYVCVWARGVCVSVCVCVTASVRGPMRR